ncbi:MnhB domain-containing protein [Parasulfuritortus cantonensis]|nr:MnhB domain-containing protein [Parasulfuritortus cantonensis]
MHRIATLLFALGLGVLLLGLAAQLPLGATPMAIGNEILARAPGEIGAANIVTSVVLAYRGIDTLGELAILFAAATAAGLVLGHAGSRSRNGEAGFILRTGSDLLFPLLLTVGFYIVLHGHLTPGGGFQGGVVLAAAFFASFLARPSHRPGHGVISLIEGLAGAAFIGIGLAALAGGGAFLQPLLDRGMLGELVSAGSLPLLYLAVGLKVGAELAGLLAQLAE